MKSIKGTRTEQNLLKAFAGESQARNRYAFFAKRARKEGYEQIGAIFDETAAQEQEHAEVFFKLIVDSLCRLVISHSFLFDKLSDPFAELDIMLKQPY